MNLHDFCSSNIKSFPSFHDWNQIWSLWMSHQYSESNILSSLQSDKGIASWIYKDISIVFNANDANIPSYTLCLQHFSHDHLISRSNSACRNKFIQSQTFYHYLIQYQLNFHMANITIIDQQISQLYIYVFACSSTCPKLMAISGMIGLSGFGFAIRTCKLVRILEIFIDGLQVP